MNVLASEFFLLSKAAVAAQQILSTPRACTLKVQFYLLFGCVWLRIERCVEKMWVLRTRNMGGGNKTASLERSHRDIYMSFDRRALFD